jgi:hypothetical protein
MRGIRAVIYVMCPSRNMVSRSYRQLDLGGALSARLSGEEGPRSMWGFSFLRAAELFALKPRGSTNDKDSARRSFCRCKP